jgi:DNA-binding NarL/FixJ family response regulator
MMLMKKLLLVEDAVNVRDNLTKIINSIGGYVIVGEASDVDEAITLGKMHLPEVIILDLNLTNSTGLDAITYLKRINSSSLVIVFTNYAKDAFKKISLRLGADYFLDKSNDFDLLVEILTSNINKN